MRLESFRDDIELVPARLDALADRLVASDPWQDVRSRVPEAGADILISGMGSSWFAASTVAGWLRSVGLRAVPELASTVPGWPGGASTVAVLVSASGSTAETLDRRGRLAPETATVALTDRAGSPLALSCDAVVELHAGPEDGEVACRSFRHTIALLAALGRPRADVALACREAARVTGAMLANRSWLDEVRSVVDGVPVTHWLAPGDSLAVAEQGALMSREVAFLAATGSEAGEWFHVDAYLAATTDYRAVVLSGSPWDRQAADWLGHTGSRVCSLGPHRLGVPGERHVPLPADPLVRSLAAPLVAELLAYDVASRSLPSPREALT